MEDFIQSGFFWFGKAEKREMPILKSLIHLVSDFSKNLNMGLT